MIFLLTVEHSGTRYLWSRFGNPRVRMVEDYEHWDPEAEWLFDHLHSYRMPIIRTLCARVRPVVTERNRDDICASWARRGKSFSVLAEQFANYDEIVSTYKPDVIKLGGGWNRLPDDIRMHV